MWASEKQQCQAILVLLRRVHLERLWTDTGPTVEASELLMEHGGPLSHGEAVMLQVAFDLWNGGGKATVGELLNTLDSVNLFLVAGLLMTLSKSQPDVDSWARYAETIR